MKRTSPYSLPSRLPSWLFGLALLAIVQVCGCSAINSGIGGALGFETDLKIQFRVSNDINPDENWTPSPVYLRLYELTDAQAWTKADFLDLYTHAKDILGAKLVGQQTLRRFAPGESRIDEFVIHEDTRFVALYAEFFHYQKATYKIVLPVTPNNVVADSYLVSVHDTHLGWRRK